jgi:molybdopterin molybdotransferase
MELPVAQLLSVDQAIAILDAVPMAPRIVQLALLEAAGLRLAEDIFSDRDYPPFDKAVMDGYAIRASDASAAGARLNVIDTIAAGQVGGKPIQSGEAVKIMTGAPLPAGADSVVPVEWTTREGTMVVLNRPVKTGNAIAKRGSDTPANRFLLKKGCRLGPAQVAVAATIGKATILVYAAPTVALLTTGDEIIDIDQTPTGSQVRNSNGPMMTALLRQLGCKVNDLGIVRDDPAKIRAAIERGLQSDALFITGGMSMGDHDYVPMLLRDLGMELKISKLRIKPGKPFVFATGHRTEGNPSMAFGLPGNPVSAYVCTIRLAARILSRLAGGTADPEIHQSILTQELPANGPREFYLPAIESDGRIQPLNPNGSADLFTLARANALIVRPENAATVNAGETVTILKLTSLPG